MMEQPIPMIKDTPPPPEITFNKQKAVINYHNLNLDVSHPSAPEVTLTMKKLPLPIIEGKVYGSNSVLIDAESEKMKAIAIQAGALKSLPEIQRAKAIMELLRANLHYAYNDAVDAIAKTNPNLAHWIATNTGVSSSASRIPLSEIFENGYGVCRHLSVAYLWLAQKAGLQGTLCCSEYRVIKNIIRSDNGEQLFKSVNVGDTTAAHMWAEIQLSNGTWIPVDPSTKLIADTPEDLAMFKQANYITAAGYGLDADWSPRELGPQGTGLIFTPGQAISETKYWLLLNSTKPIIRIPKNIPPTNKPYSGDGQLEIQATQDYGMMNLEFVDVK